MSAASIRPPLAVQKQKQTTRVALQSSMAGVPLPTHAEFFLFFSFIYLFLFLFFFNPGASAH